MHKFSKKMVIFFKLMIIKINYFMQVRFLELCGIVLDLAYTIIVILDNMVSILGKVVLGLFKLKLILGAWGKKLMIAGCCYILENVHTNLVNTQKKIEKLRIRWKYKKIRFNLQWKLFSELTAYIVFLIKGRSKIMWRKFRKVPFHIRLTNMLVKSFKFIITYTITSHYTAGYYFKYFLVRFLIKPYVKPFLTKMLNKVKSFIYQFWIISKKMAQAYSLWILHKVREWMAAALKWIKNLIIDVLESFLIFLLEKLQAWRKRINK